MQAKPWQIAVIVVAAVVLVVSIIYQTSGSRDVKLSTELTMADVETGELFILERGKEQTLLIPFSRPGSDSATLLPAGQEPDGKWVILRRYRASLKQTMGAIADVNTGEIRVKEGKPQRIKA